MIRLVLFFSTILACLAHAQGSVSESEIPNANAFLGWTEKFGYVTLRVDFNKLPKVKLVCADKNLYPTHADQSTKQYHVFNTGDYDRTKLKFDDEMCTKKSLFKNSQGNFYCMTSDWMETAVISDTYTDSCGHLYRGYWRVTYKHSNESMGTLFSKGRAMYPNPNSQFEGDYRMGGTFAVKEADFMFLAPLFKVDRKKIQEAFARSQTSWIRYNKQTRLFEEYK